MTKFFCADASRQAGEDIIGSGTPYAIYVLVECPAPWAFETWDSSAVPQNLRDLVQEVQQEKLSIRFLLISGQPHKTTPQTKLLIYQQERYPFVGGYTRSEWNVDGIEQVADLVKGYLAGERTGDEVQHLHDQRDILICTHGSHDQCCARYGLPFYRQAIAIVSALHLDHVRIWKASHFGGHRFAPTAIDFPNGRYYGVLDAPSFQALLTRTGDIHTLRQVYRGWGILPTSLQVLERELMLHYGWNWFTCKIMHRILEQSENQEWIRAALSFEASDGSVCTYQAELIQDNTATRHLKRSCHATQNAASTRGYLVQTGRTNDLMG